MRIDQAGWWSLIPIGIALVAGVLLADVNLVIGAAIAAPIAIAAGIATARRWRAGIEAALGGVLIGVLVRFAGLLVGGLAIHLTVAAPLPAITILAGCLVIGLFIDAVLRSLPDEDPVRG